MLKQTPSLKILVCFILVFLTFILAIQEKAFLFNPLSLILFLAAYNFSFWIFSLVSLTYLVTSLTISLSYGKEMALVIFIYFVIYIFIKLLKKDYFILEILPQIIIFTLYLFNEMNILNLCFSFVISLIYSWAFYQIKHKFNDTSISLVLAFIIICFYSYPNLLLFLFSLLMVYLLKNGKRSIACYCLIITYLNFNIFANFNLLIVNTIFISYIGLILFYSRKVLYFYPLILSFCLFFYSNNFYHLSVYYLVLGGYLTGIFVPYWPQSSYLKQDALLSFCLLLGDNRFENNGTMEEKMVNQIEKKICTSCSLFHNCSLALEKYLDKEYYFLHFNELKVNCNCFKRLKKELENGNEMILDFYQKEQPLINFKRRMNHLLQIFPYLQNQQEEHLSKKLKLVMEVKKDQSLHSGDHYYFDEKKQYLLLSDGMGHDYNSSLVSSYTISLISLLINQNMDIVEALKYVNDIIRLKTYDEIYATLDIGYFDCKNKKLLLYKVGAFSTFLIRNHQLFEYQTRVPPLGIIDQIHVRLEEIKMEKGDIFLFITDGFGEDINTLIETTLDQVTILSFKSYLNLLYDTLNKYNSNDDKTLIGIKIVDNL